MSCAPVLRAMFLETANQGFVSFPSGAERHNRRFRLAFAVRRASQALMKTDLDHLPEGKRRELASGDDRGAEV